MTHRVSEFRSDTFTLPSEKMREAMRNAECGDDVVGEDPTMNRLQALAAELLGKEAALFVPSGTFGNQLAIYTHSCPSNEVILSESAHIIEHGLHIAVDPKFPRLLFVAVRVWCCTSAVSCPASLRDSYQGRSSLLSAAHCTCSPRRDTSLWRTLPRASAMLRIFTCRRRG